MKVVAKFCLALMAVALVATQCDAQRKGKSDVDEKKELKVGDPAPDWEMKGSDGKTYKLSDFKDKKAVVVFWYPMALTGG